MFPLSVQARLFGLEMSSSPMRMASSSSSERAAAEVARLAAERFAKEQKTRERLKAGELGVDFYGLADKARRTRRPLRRRIGDRVAAARVSMNVDLTIGFVGFGEAGSQHRKRSEIRRRHRGFLLLISIRTEFGQRAEDAGIPLVSIRIGNWRIRRESSSRP